MKVKTLYFCFKRELVVEVGVGLDFSRVNVFLFFVKIRDIKRRDFVRFYYKV